MRREPSPFAFCHVLILPKPPPIAELIISASVLTTFSSWIRLIACWRTVAARILQRLNNIGTQRAPRMIQSVDKGESDGEGTRVPAQC
jgi:hypothetical protein